MLMNCGLFSFQYGESSAWRWVCVIWYCALHVCKVNQAKKKFFFSLHSVSTRWVTIFSHRIQANKVFSVSAQASASHYNFPSTTLSVQFEKITAHLRKIVNFGNQRASYKFKWFLCMCVLCVLCRNYCLLSSLMSVVKHTQDVKRTNYTHKHPVITMSYKTGAHGWREREREKKIDAFLCDRPKLAVCVR